MLVFSAVVDVDEQETGPFALIGDVGVRGTDVGSPADAAHPRLHEHHPASGPPRLYRVGGLGPYAARD
ncbi:hypothetical protein QF037_009604 [Streptomyces canus]|nr:hypothetical protein [Streptomyces canus]